MLNAFFFINMYQLASFQSTFPNLLSGQRKAKWPGPSNKAIIIYLNKRKSCDVGCMSRTQNTLPYLRSSTDYMCVAGRVFSM